MCWIKVAWWVLQGFQPVLRRSDLLNLRALHFCCCHFRAGACRGSALSCCPRAPPALFPQTPASTGFLCFPREPFPSLTSPQNSESYILTTGLIFTNCKLLLAAATFYMPGAGSHSGVSKITSFSLLWFFCFPNTLVCVLPFSGLSPVCLL